MEIISPKRILIYVMGETVRSAWKLSVPELVAVFVVANLSLAACRPMAPLLFVGSKAVRA